MGQEFKTSYTYDKETHELVVQKHPKFNLERFEMRYIRKRR